MTDKLDEIKRAEEEFLKELAKSREEGTPLPAQYQHPVPRWVVRAIQKALDQGRDRE